ncbi:hypothetical protein AGABI2DRAFT_199389 [Agaricus bisporus var. bisporus H97]|uniref:hypothetical protein n=1 Tax=Agaricus bisporus var. bisporus (strain H97 / ATCC MYA-4626 / FGSC 10389) TaxID=936046 RepID=UPI00029F7668|nr:hypothetical protein AGABI2DRAFT_199389 [Agaricus bisporus var. bisporus H97]EKV50070.1 hypothetical protein AGABI2DRAFT_199389 [Agaricus bisporus var. bisporus H97]
MASHALLLRLFLSPSFFSLHLALNYLRLYADNVGITYYLTRRLRELDVHQLYDVWGFICHLLVTRPSKSRALEVFVVETAQRSTHIAMITLWYMQASLHDLSLTRRESPSFTICQRVLHKCHEIIFNDLPRPTSSPYPPFKLSARGSFARRRIRHHAEPAFVGMGVILAAAPAMPALADFTGQIALEQGRADDDGQELRSLRSIETDLVLVTAPKTADSSGIDDDMDPETDSPPNEESGLSQADNHEPLRQDAPIILRRRTVTAAQTVPALPLHLRTIRRSRASEDPLGQLDYETLPAAPAQSSPALPATRTPPRFAAAKMADGLLEKYDLQAQTQLLRGHYCHSEVQFILDLENLCNRLLIVPKPARVSALRAELTALNHKLPAEVCMPMWCNSSDIPQGPNNIPKPHHRIVRIPPGESVVLNSAERAPYLLLIEIIHDDLDFDPSKRANKEVLRKIVSKEEEKKGASNDLVSFGRSKSKQSDAQTGTEGGDLTVDTDIPHSSLPIPVPYESFPPPDTLRSAESDNPEEEIDLVEQLYGAEQPLRSANLDLAESIVLPPAPKNRDLDMAAWSSTANVDDTGTPRRNSAPRTPIGNGNADSSDKSTLPPIGQVNGAYGVLSLDEYFERMRTAAIMLAQLNANLVRDQAATTYSSPPGSLSSTAQDVSSPSSSSSMTAWIPGSGWLMGSSPLTSDASQPSPSGAAQGRMRLQHAQAQQIRDRIMKEMLALEEERMERMKENGSGFENGISWNRAGLGIRGVDLGSASGENSVEDEGIIRRELNKADPSAVVFSESWATKKSRIKAASPYGHLANWDCVSVIVKTGGDLRQEQLAVQLIQEFQRIWTEENCPCWVRYFRIVILGAASGLVETITDAVSIHSIKKAEYAKRLARNRLGYVTLMDHFKSAYGDPSSAKFARAQRNFAKSLAGYSIITYLLQVKDRHNGNILLDREGHLIHIDFGFILSNTPGNIGFEAAPFKLPLEYIEVLGGENGVPFMEFKRLFREGFEAARKHCDRILTLVELMQRDSTLPCFALYGEQTVQYLKDRFQPTLTHSLIGEYVDRLIDTSLGSHWTRLYDSYQYYSQSIL